MRLTLLILLFVVFFLTRIQFSFGQVNETHNKVWPDVPFIPSLIYVEPGSDQMCANYEFGIRAEFFKGYTSSSYTPEHFLPIENVEIIDLNLTMRNGWFDFYKGNINDDVEIDFFISVRSAGGYRSNYIDHHQLVPLSSATASTYLASLEDVNDTFDGNERDKKIIALQSQLIATSEVQKFIRNRPEVTTVISDSDLENLAKVGYQLIANSLRMINYNGRSYADTLVNAYLETVRVLISYDSDMRPKTECMVNVIKRGKVESGPFAQSAPYELMQNSLRMIGSRNACTSGTRNPFAELRKWHETTIRNAMYSPWKIVNEFLNYEHRDKENSYYARIYFAYLIDNKLETIVPEYQYIWSLKEVQNRRKFNLLDANYNPAIIQLMEYYIRTFKVDEDTANFWARFYTHALRYNSSGHASISPNPATVKRIKTNVADTNDYLEIASLQHIFHFQMQKSVVENEYPDIVYDRALNLATGSGAELEVLTELIAQGANLNGGDEPIIFNAIDNTDLLKFYLEKGVNINRRNGFGKSALMMAAHLNNEDAIALLLNAGANPNDKTWIELPNVNNEFSFSNGTDCRYWRLWYRGRTALMYAAENASLKVIKLLVEAGADVSAIDNQNRNIEQYLEMNTVLSDSELINAKALLNIE